MSILCSSSQISARDRPQDDTHATSGDLFSRTRRAHHPGYHCRVHARFWRGKSVLDSASVRRAIHRTVHSTDLRCGRLPLWRASSVVEHRRMTERSRITRLRLAKDIAMLTYSGQHRARPKPSAWECDRMRYLSLAVAACVLAACGAPHTKQVVAQVEPTPAGACAAGANPLLVVDGVVQATSCGRSKAETTLQCRADGPLYVIDGVKTCTRP